MIALRSDQPRQRTTHVLVCSQSIDDGLEIISRAPAKFVASALIHVNAIDAGKHLPLPAIIFGLILRNALVAPRVAR